MSFKDHFSAAAGAYARYRPEYPPALFEFLATLTPRRQLALDCATGSGQAARGLAEHFAQVIASDASVPQLRNARPHPRVAYLANLAEQLALQDQCVDLVVVAQAAHWFDHVRFYQEVRRVLRPDGALAIWTYGLARISPALDAAINTFYETVIGPYWPPERRHIESGYRELPFPWHELPAPTFELVLEWDLDEFMGYVGTWSAVQRYTRLRGADPLPALRAQLAALWNLGPACRSVTWCLHLRLGKP